MLLALPVNEPEPDIEGVFKIFSDKTLAPDHLLPDTGMEYKLEKMLSSIFIESSYYGTMASSVMTIENTGVVTLHEKTYNPDRLTSVSFIME